jgi:Sulfotransferase family
MARGVARNRAAGGVDVMRRTALSAAPLGYNPPLMTPAVTGTSTAPIFVVGHPRSGTTLLRMILDAHPRIVIPPEGHLVSLLRRAERKYGKLEQPENFELLIDRVLAKKRMAEWKIDLDEARRRCLAGPHTPGGVFASLMSMWTDRTGKPRWGEKTPGTYRFLPEVNRWFPDCQVLHIVRDGRDVAVSCLTPPFSDQYDKGNVYEVAVRWRDAIRRGRHAGGMLGAHRYLELRYEDLTAAPEAVVRAICQFLGEEFVPEMLRFHEKSKDKVPRGEQSYHQRLSNQVDTQRVERWRKDVNEDFVLGFEGIAGKELEENGYRLSGYAPRPALRARILLERIKPRNPVKHYKGSEGEEKPRPAGGRDRA